MLIQFIINLYLLSPLGIMQDQTIPTSLWDMIGYAQGFEWPLGIIFLIGLFLLTSAYVRQFRQWRGTNTLLNFDLKEVSLEKFSTALEQTNSRNPFARVACRLMEEQKRGGTSEAMVNYAFHFIRLDHEKYKETDRYITAAVYIALSLGLLGTLLGIFFLFMSGSRHESSDLVGLGIAVVSTMLALIVRLILWPLNVFLQAMLRKRYTQLKEWTITLAYTLSKNNQS